MDTPIVIKVGTGVLTRAEDSTLDGGALLRLVNAIAQTLGHEGKCILVSSGAMGAGVTAFDMTSFPEDLPTKQAVAAVGQCRLMHAYENLFGQFRLNVAQILRTADDFRNERRRSNTRATLLRLLAQPRVIPIANQNDSVAFRNYSIGDNDMLAARISELIGARMMIIFSSVDGLYKDGDIGGDVVRDVHDIDTVMSHASEESRGRMSSGGMVSKLKSIKKALDAGVECVIANGREPERLHEIVEGRGLCTRFHPKKSTEEKPVPA